jgi:hypothetical protein
VFEGERTSVFEYRGSGRIGRIHRNDDAPCPRRARERRPTGSISSEERDEEGGVAV